MSATKQVDEMIDVTPFLDHIYMNMKLFGDFMRECKRKGVDMNEYLTIAIKQEIENGLKYDLIG